MSQTTVTVLFGTNEQTVTVDTPTLAAVVAHPQVQAWGIGDNVEFKSRGVVLSPYAPVANGDTVSVTQKKSDKGC